MSSTKEVMTREELVEKLIMSLPFPEVNKANTGECIQLLRCGCDFWHSEPLNNVIKISIDHKTFTTFDGDSSHIRTASYDLVLVPSPEKQIPPLEEGVRMDYTRDELIKICESAVVQESKWCDRDTPSSQQQVGHLYAKLLCNMPFQLINEGGMKPNKKTIWVWCDGDTFYLPTFERLAAAGGNDWY